MKVGVFDSGVGGLTVLQEIKKLPIPLEVIYYGDSFRAPYGSREAEEIKQFSYEIAEFLSNNQVDIIVIACNTATVASIEHLKKEFPHITVIGVINPGAVAAIEATNNNKIGIISTVLTAKTNAYKTEIQNINNNMEVYQQGCEALCPMVEAGWETHEDRMSILEGYITELPADIDTLVLGCTHYPIFTEDAAKIFKGSIINPAFKTTELVYEALDKKFDLKNKIFDNNDKTITFFTSGELELFKSVAEKFLGSSVDSLFRVVL